MDEDKPQVIYEVWAQISSTERHDKRRDYDRMFSVWGNSWLYNIGVLVGSIVLLAPGIYVLIAGSLGIVFVCVEQENAATAFEASRQLITGNFWRAARYLVPTVLLVYGGMFGTMFGAAFIVGIFDENLATGPLLNSMQFLLGLGGEWAILSILPLQVRLYQYLKELKGKSVATLSHAADR